MHASRSLPRRRPGRASAFLCRAGLLCLPALSLLLIPAFLAVAADPTTPNSGISGVVMAGPVTPAERPGTPSAVPVPKAIVSIQPDGGGTEVARGQADAAGRFRLPLVAGHYWVFAMPPPPGKTLSPGKPQAVEVSDGKFSEIVLVYDTGIR